MILIISTILIVICAAILIAGLINDDDNMIYISLVTLAIIMMLGYGIAGTIVIKKTTVEYCKPEHIIKTENSTIIIYEKTLIKDNTVLLYNTPTNNIFIRKIKNYNSYNSIYSIIIDAVVTNNVTELETPLCGG